MKQRTDAFFAPTNWQTTPTTDIQSALDALAAKIATIPTHRPTVPLQPAAMKLSESPPMHVSTTGNLSNDDDGNHLHHARCQLSSITDTFNLQAKMLRNLNTMVLELIGTVALIVAAIIPPNNSTKIAPLHPPTTSTIICQTTKFTFTDHLQNTQIPPWSQHHTASSDKLAFKSSPYQKHIPAKPPFNRGRQTCRLVKARKDSLRPP